VTINQTKEAAFKWFDEQSPEDQRTIALSAIERLIENEEVNFRRCLNEPDEDCLFWVSCGEDLRIPF
jgi:hypothetical protein